MVKYLFNFLLMFLMLSSFSLAGVGEVQLEKKLKNEFGEDLSHAPFFLRFNFYKEFDKDWKKSSYSERKVFLTNYETNLAAEQSQQKADAKAQADKEKQFLLDKKEALHKEKERLKARQEEERLEEVEEKERQKEFDASLKGQQKSLEEMQRQSTQGAQ